MSKSNLSLYEITDELEQLRDALLDSGGEITEEMNERFDDLLDAEEDKTEGYIAVIQSMKAQAQAFKEEERRLKKRRKAAKKTADRLQERLLDSMERRGQQVRETGLGKVRVQTASRRGTTVLSKVDDLPEHFRRVKTSADKTAISEALQSDDPDVRAEAERHAQLDEPTRYVQIY